MGRLRADLTVAREATAHNRPRPAVKGEGERQERRPTVESVAAYRCDGAGDGTRTRNFQLGKLTLYR
jgi:hypothetical protein